MTAKHKIRNALSAEWLCSDELAQKTGLCDATVRQYLPELMREKAAQRRKRKGAKGRYEYSVAEYRGAVAPRPYRTGMVWWSTAWG